MAKPSYKRAERVADQIRMEVAEILARKSKDPRLASLTVTGVDLSADLRLAKIYVTAFQEGASIKDIFRGLHHAVGFIRTELGRRMALRYTPELVFLYDASGRQGDKVCQLLDQLHLQGSKSDELPHSPDPFSVSEN